MAEYGVPRWVTDIYNRLHGGVDGPRFVMRKTLTESDTSPQQNRLLIPSELFRDNLKPVLAERVAELNSGRLDVHVYLPNQWCLYPRLTHWLCTGAVVINGTEYGKLVKLGNFRAGDQVEMWAFRAGNSLCFALGKVV